MVQHIFAQLGLYSSALAELAGLPEDRQASSFQGLKVREASNLPSALILAEPQTPNPKP